MTRNAIALILFLLIAGPFGVLGDERSSNANPKQITVRLLEYRFEPAQITFNTGAGVELTLVNEGTVLHEFVTEALHHLTVDLEINGVVAEIHGVAEFEIPPKAKVLLRFIPEKPGEFLIACRAREPKDHFKAGMVGRLLIR